MKQIASQKLCPHPPPTPCQAGETELSTDGLTWKYNSTMLTPQFEPIWVQDICNTEIILCLQSA